MTSTLVGYFDNYEEAKRTEADLIGSGFGQTEVRIVGGEEQPVEAEQKRSTWDSLKEMLGLIPEEERTYYEEAARHGALLAVNAPDEKVDLAAEIIESHHPSDLDRQMGEWGARPAPEETGGREATEGESIPIIEERMKVGKQTVRRGGVRIHHHVSETPVEETVPLKEEEVHVERHPADRPATEADEAFRGRTIEIEEMAEEPVVEKEARVVEEVEVGKQVKEREAKVRDDLRKTQVEIEEIPEKKKRD